MYLVEAFKALNALDEDAFSVEKDGIEKLAQFQDDDNVDPEMKIIDPDAESEEELQDSYVGKVILECQVCHSLIYKLPEEVEIDEEGELANIGDECPYCYTSGGYKIVGQVGKFNTTECKENVCPECGKTIDKCICDKDEENENKIQESLKTRKRKRIKESAESGKAFWSAGYKVGDKLQSDSMGEVEVLALNKGKDYAIFKRNKGLQPFIAAWSPQLYDDKLSWGQGHYFSNKDDVMKYFNGIDESLNERLLDPLDESVENIQVQTDTDTIDIKPEDGGVTVSTGTSVDVEKGEETIQPLSPETEEELTGADSVDRDIDEFDEESFDELGESYFRKVYENVDSYKTTRCKVRGNKMIVEGVIKFNSGKAKKTSFIFESRNCTKGGKYSFLGENMQFTKGTKAFTLRGTIDGGKFITESLNYNYIHKTPEGKSLRISGISKR